MSLVEASLLPRSVVCENVLFRFITGLLFGYKISSMWHFLSSPSTRSFLLIFSRFCMFCVRCNVRFQFGALYHLGTYRCLQILILILQISSVIFICIAFQSVFQLFFYSWKFSEFGNSIFYVPPLPLLAEIQSFHVACFDL